MRIDLLIPSRGRPEDAKRAALTALGLASHDVHVFIVIDDNDPMLEEYRQLTEDSNVTVSVVEHSERRGIVDPMNLAAVFHAREADYIGFMGDDHRVRTPAWDEIVRKHYPAYIVYGDDKFQGVALPTAAFLRSEIIESLGFIAPPILQHLYVDNYWKALGEKLNSLVYDPELVIEHLHPDIIGKDGKPKGQYDDLKRELNSQEVYTRDRVAFMQYEAGGFLDKDAKKVLDGKV